MADPVNPSARRVRDRLRELDFDVAVLELPGGTRTAAAAARAAGCRVDQIAKSPGFRGRETGAPRPGALAGEPVEKPDAAFVRERTGFAIGGVPPVGHREPLATFIDEGLLRHVAII